MQIKMTVAQKLMAWILNKECRWTQAKIAQHMGVRQSTISLAIKEAGYWIKNENLTMELSELRQMLTQQGIFIQQLIAQQSVESANNCGLFQFQSTDSNGLFVPQTEAQRNNAMNTFSNLC